jgi:hypothetical protein
MQFRRRIPRQPAGWDGVCQIEGEFAAKCRVIDISMIGLGITLEHPSPAELAGRHISVDVPTVIGHSFRMRLDGKIANAKTTRGRAVRVGIEFDQPFEAGLGTTILESTMSDDNLGALLPRQEYYSAIARERGYDHKSAQDIILLITEEIGELARQNPGQRQRLSQTSKTCAASSGDGLQTRLDVS